MEKYSLKGHRGEVYFQLPGAWRVINHATSKPKKTNKSVSQLVSDAIANPMGAPALVQLVKGKKKIAIIVDDITRPTPKKAILTPLLDHLREYGVRNSQMTVLIATGTHRPLSGAEIQEIFGETLCREINMITHNCRANDLVSIGILKHGGDLRIHPLAVEADLRIAVGSILPHPQAGFGGGAKAILPGIAGYESVRNHHIALMLAKGVFLGNCESNPFLSEIRDAGRLARLDFIINAVYDSDENVKAIVAGHFEEAHRAGIEICSKELGVRFNQAADVTILSAFPYTEGPQVLKPLGASNMVTKEGGAVILYASRIEGGKFPAPFLEAFDTVFAMAGGDPRRLVTDYIRDNKPLIPGITMDFDSAITHTLVMQRRTRMVLVSEDADQVQAARLGFGYASSVQEAIDRVAKDAPKAKATVNIMPSAGLVLPIVPESMRVEW
jgi:nickel-dependent lactate racemase